MEERTMSKINTATKTSLFNQSILALIWPNVRSMLMALTSLGRVVLIADERPALQSAALHGCIEACDRSHYWVRELVLMGHGARLIAPKFVKPYVMSSRNDRADAAASSARPAGLILHSAGRVRWWFLYASHWAIRSAVYWPSYPAFDVF